MSEITTVFSDSCTDAVGNPNTVLYAAQQQRFKPNRGYNRENYRGNHQNNGNRFNNNNYSRNNRNRGQYRGNYAGRGISNSGHNNNNNNVRITQNASGNSQQPLGTQQ